MLISHMSEGLALVSPYLLSRLFTVIVFRGELLVRALYVNIPQIMESTAMYHLKPPLMT